MATSEQKTVEMLPLGHQDDSKQTLQATPSSEKHETPMSTETTSVSTTTEVPPDVEAAEQAQYVRGMKLFMIMMSLLMTFFTVLLDTVRFILQFSCYSQADAESSIRAL